ncbi:MAG: DUF2326 domain-containing protein [Planctomycetes bacterium]|nr:DUF2326 domain-containing protein [Planctomycetota bacterium]
MSVEIEGTTHNISRSADKPKEITLDGDEITLPKLRSFLEDALFEVVPNIDFISFRSIIQRFIRSGRSAYVDFSYASEGENKKPYGAMLRSAFLLGLDLNLARKKYDLRNRKTKLKDTMKQLEEEPLFAELMAQGTVDIELAALVERVAKLQQDLASFRVAEDYYEIELAADEIKRDLNRVRRETIKLNGAIAQIDRSLQSKGDLPPERVFQLYKEAQAALPSSLQHKIEEVIAFQQDLQKKRVYRLTKERQRLNHELLEQQGKVKLTGDRLDQKLKYLSEHKALDEYVGVTGELAEVQLRVAKLEASRALRNKVDRELLTIDRDLAEENIRTDDYLQTASALIDEASALFRSYGRELYGSRTTGLSITNDSGDNQQRYQIEAHISSDAAEGINEAKIFCYDMTILVLHRGHRSQFLAHDSSLFGPIDPRQRLAMIQIADRVSREFGMQYIAMLNSHDITSIKEQTDLESEESDRLFGNNSVVLRLTDGSPRDKLLGIDVDMDYTK